MASLKGRQSTESLYFYSSQPRVIPTGRYRCPDDYEDYTEDECPIHYGNIMYDKRVVRGSNYARKVITNRGCPDYSKTGKKPKRVPTYRWLESDSSFVVGDGEQRVRTPDPVPGRRHFTSQTEQFAKEFKFFAEKSNVFCQTDAFVNVIPRPFTKNAKTGIDAETEICPEELFDFDEEVSDPLDVLLANVTEQSLMETMAEEELAAICKQQNILNEYRKAEKEEEERLEEETRRRQEEKVKQMKEREEKMRLEQETLEKMAARIYAERYLSDLLPHMFGVLTDNNFLYDAVERELEFEFMPWLMSRTQEKLRLAVAARTIMDEMLRRVQQQRLEDDHAYMLIESDTDTSASAKSLDKA